MEGLHLVEEAAKSGLRLHTVFVRDGNEGLLEHLAVGEAEVLIVAEEVFLSATTDGASAGHRRPGGDARVHPGGDASAEPPWC